MEPITVSTVVRAPIEKVWSAWTEPEHIKAWNSASPDWHTPAAENDLRVGGGFKSRMEARDGSAGFDFAGTYTAIEERAKIEYAMEDGRRVSVTFAPEADGVRVTETFDPENESPAEMQREGWQAILENFRKHAESL